MLALCLSACNPPQEPAYSPEYGVGEVQAIIEIGEGGPMPFLDERGVQAVLFPGENGGQLVLHAGSDRDRDVYRLAWAMVFELDDPQLPGAVDIERHTFVLMELDSAGQAKLVIDGPSQGVVEVHGTFEPGSEVSGTFSLEIEGTDEMGTPIIARLDGTFSAVIQVPPT